MSKLSEPAIRAILDQLIKSAYFAAAATITSVQRCNGGKGRVVESKNERTGNAFRTLTITAADGRVVVARERSTPVEVPADDNLPLMLAVAVEDYLN